MLFKLEKKLDNKSRKKMGSNENVAVEYPSLKNLDSEKTFLGECGLKRNSVPKSL